MDFFHKLAEMANLEKLTEMAKNVSEMANESLELNKMISEINLTKGNIEVYKREIGEYYWAQFAVGEKLDEEPMLICDKIVAAQDKIRGLEAKIAQIKADREAEKAERKAQREAERAERKGEREAEKAERKAARVVEEAAAEADFYAEVDFDETEEVPIAVCAECGAVVEDGQKVCDSCQKAAQ